MPRLTDDQWWDGLTEKQRRFCEAFAENGGRAVPAAEEAGYSRPDPEGARLLGNARVKAALERLRLSTTSQKIATREERQAFWTAMMRGEEPGEPKDRLKASELLGKSQGDFIERHEHSQSGPVSLTLSLVKAEPRHD